MAPPAASRRYRWPVSAYGGAGRPRGTAREARYPAASIVARVPEVVRAKALAAGAAHWLRDLDDLVASLEREWSMAVGRGYDGGTEAFVAEATLADGSHAVLKPLVPRAGEAARHEITVLRLAGGRGCARLLRGRGARRAAARTARPPAARASASAAETTRHPLLGGGAMARGVVERVSTGLLCTRIGVQPVGRQMLATADQVAG